MNTPPTTEATTQSPERLTGDKRSTLVLAIIGCALASTTAQIVQSMGQYANPQMTAAAIQRFGTPGVIILNAYRASTVIAAVLLGLSVGIMLFNRPRARDAAIAGVCVALVHTTLITVMTGAYALLDKKNMVPTNTLSSVALQNLPSTICFLGFLAFLWRSKALTAKYGAIKLRPWG